MKMKALLGSVLLALLILVAGCSDDSTTGNDSDTNTDGGLSGDLDVTIITEYGGDGEEVDTIESMVNDYMELNPNVNVNLQIEQINTNDHRTWVTTQLLGGTAPDVFTTRYVWDQEDLQKGLLTDLTPYFQEENPYADNQVWEDTFQESVLEQLKGADKSYAGVPQYVNAVRVIYNKDVFEEVGVEVPETWSEFIDTQEKLKEHDIVPFAMPNSGLGDNALNWASRILIDQLLKDNLDTLDHNGSGVLDLNEYVKAVEEGQIDNTKSPYKDVWTILKDWSPYWSNSYNGLNYDSAVDMFLRGDSAMMLMALSAYKSVDKSDARDFEVGAFPIPILTKDIHEDASERVTELGTVPQMPLVIPADIDENKKELAIDFIKYTTSPEVQSMNAEKLYRAPVVKDIPLPAKLEGFQLVGDNYTFKLYAPAFDRNLAEISINQSQLYLQDDITNTEFMEVINEGMRDGVSQMMESNDWNADNNYGLE
ncbi:extracellular solute-binding protein [Radiobacillus sp. PE A8.2]|uniref:ABC transporter substrate-binding protein n=1 Tax=Radiobacillus sp. PE A8.2 TaxID=3380349 RepID=UPI003890334A